MKKISLSLPLIVLFLGFIGYQAFKRLQPVPKPLELADSPEPKIAFANLAQNAARRDQSILEDSAPLFLPTKWNASTSPRTGQSADFAKISFYPPELFSENSSLFTNGPELPFTPPRLNNISAWLSTPFSTFSLGKNQPPMEKPNPTGGLMLINRVGMSDEPRTYPIPNELLAKAEKGTWTPVEFFYTVENLTPMGQPVQTKFSGIPELDQALTRFAKLQASSKGLPSGYYRITAYP